MLQRLKAVKEEEDLVNEVSYALHGTFWLFHVSVHATFASCTLPTLRAPYSDNPFFCFFQFHSTSVRHKRLVARSPKHEIVTNA